MPANSTHHPVPNPRPDARKKRRPFPKNENMGGGSRHSAKEKNAQPANADLTEYSAEPHCSKIPQIGSPERQDDTAVD